MFIFPDKMFFKPKSKLHEINFASHRVCSDHDQLINDSSRRMVGTKSNLYFRKPNIGMIPTFEEHWFQSADKFLFHFKPWRYFVTHSFLNIHPPIYITCKSSRDNFYSVLNMLWSDSTWKMVSTVGIQTHNLLITSLLP